MRKGENIVVQGLEMYTENTEQPKEVMTNFIIENVELEVEVEWAYKLGQNTCMWKYKET